MEESSAKLTKTQIHGGLVLVHRKLGNSLETKYNSLFRTWGNLMKFGNSQMNQNCCPKNDRSTLTFIDCDSHDDAVAATKWDDPLKWQPFFCWSFQLPSWLGMPQSDPAAKSTLNFNPTEKKQLSYFTIGTCNP